MIKSYLFFIPILIILLCAFTSEVNVTEYWMDEAIKILKFCIMFAYVFSHFLTLIPRRVIADLPYFFQLVVYFITANYYHSHDLERPRKL